MYNYEFLMEKITEHRKVHDRFLQMFGNLLETAMNMQSLTADLNLHYDDILKQLKADAISPPPSHKRRKAQSFESPSTVIRAEDCSMIRNKSDTEVSNTTLNQNINLPDSEDSFFAMTQSPSRDPLSPKAASCQEDNVQETPPKKSWFKTTLFPGPDEKKPQEVFEKKKKKNSLSLSRFSTSFCSSPETSKQIEQLPVRPKLTTPKPLAASGLHEQQENTAPAVGKWTAKRAPSGSLVKTSSSIRTTPTSAKKDNSLLNRTRLRQTKLRFPDNMNKSMVDDDETYFDEFVVPSPTSFSGSRFLKSVKKKEQSSLVADDDVFKSSDRKMIKPARKTANFDEDDFDIDQTYFSEAEKDLSRPGETVIPQVGPAATVKLESKVHKKPSNITKVPVLARETQPDEDPDTSSVLFVKPPSQEDIITIDETQPNKNDLFMAAIREERRKEDESRKSVLNVMGPPRPLLKQESTLPSKNDKSPMRKTLDLKLPEERRCIECSKHYRFMVNCGLAADVIRGKLPRNCRECRNAQLHETPPGFWNPEFSPTQKN